MLTTVVSSLGPMEQKERTGGQKLSSDLHLQVMTQMPTHMCIHISTETHQYNKKEGGNKISLCENY